MKKIIFISTCFLFVLACKKDFVVENIGKKTLTVNAPANNTSTSSNLITFWWEPLDGAETYNLQIVRPDFSKIEKLLLDTNVTGTKFNWSLNPGSYQWRIKAANAGYSTAFQTYNLKIDTTTDMTEQLVQLISPITNAVTGSTVITFTWKALNAAKKYQFQIDGGLVKDTTLQNTSVTFSLYAAKNATTSYSWNVKAINDFSESQFNPADSKVIIDRKGPSQPGFVNPAYSATLTNVTDSLKWTHGSDAKYDSVYVSDDSLFVNNVSALWSDELFIKVSEFGLSPNLPGNFYYWRVRSFDQYNNPSTFSLRKRFKLN